MRSHRKRVGQHVLDLLEVFALQFRDGTVEPCHDIVVLLADETVDRLLVEGAHGGLFVGLAGEQDLLDGLVLQVAAELEAVDFRHVVVHHHHGDLLEAVFVMHLAMDHVQADIDHVAGDALVAAVPIEREEPLHHRRFQVGAIQRHQGRKG